jgi:hypothetical protein
VQSLLVETGDKVGRSEGFPLLDLPVHPDLLDPRGAFVFGDAETGDRVGVLVTTKELGDKVDGTADAISLLHPLPDSFTICFLTGRLLKSDDEADGGCLLDGLKELISLP